MTTKMRNS